MAYDKTKAVFVIDDEELDGTDWASPAWWRGNDLGVAVLTRIVDSWLEDEKGIYTRSGSYAYAPLTKVRDKVRALMDSNMAMRDKLIAEQAEHTTTVMDLARQLSNMHVELQNRKKIFKGLVNTNENQRTEIRELRGLLERYVAFALATIGDAKIVADNDIFLQNMAEGIDLVISESGGLDDQDQSAE